MDRLANEETYPPVGYGSLEGLCERIKLVPKMFRYDRQAGTTRQMLVWLCCDGRAPKLEMGCSTSARASLGRYGHKGRYREDGIVNGGETLG